VTVGQAYARCRAITRAEARNFYFGFVLLPPERRSAIYAAYAFSRRADDSVDGTESMPAKLAAVAERRRELDACYAGEPAPDDPVLVALADTVRRFGIPRVHLDALLDGVEMDLTRTRYPDFPALEHYCDHVAGAVGLTCLYIFGFHTPEAPETARELGVALQLVNIMRDVAEDAGRDRIYLPEDEMRAHGVDPGDLLSLHDTPEFRSLMRAQAARAREWMLRGERLLPLLDRRTRMCVGMLSALYRDILDHIEAIDYDVLHHRVSLPTGRKLRLMGSQVLAAHR
jgi:phytoene synthase